MKWQAIAPGKTYEDGGELVVFFSKGSGSTHLINPVAALVLECLSSGPLSTDELLDQVAGQVDDVSAEEMQVFLLKLLEELRESELVDEVRAG